MKNYTSYYFVVVGSHRPACPDCGTWCPDGKPVSPNDCQSCKDMTA